MNLDTPIQTDLLCVKCGYNLRGLQPSSKCPECNADVQDSCYGDLLRYADRQWVDRILLGTKLFIVAFTFLTLSSVILLLVLLVELFLPELHESIPLLLFVSKRVLISLFWLSAAGMTLGVIFITSQEPRSYLAESVVSPRRVTQGCLGAVVILLIWLYVTTSSSVGIVLEVLVCFFLLGILSFLRGLRPFGKRLEQQKWHRWIRLRYFVFVFLLIVHCFSILVMAFSPLQRFLGQVWIVILIVASIATAISSITLVGLVDRFRIAVVHERKSAR